MTYMDRLMMDMKTCFFLDLSKEFDKTWHKRLMYKLKQNGVTVNLLNIKINFVD